MSHKLKIQIRIDDTLTNQIYRFNEEQYPITTDEGADKLYRLKVIGGTLNQQEIIIIYGSIVEVGDPVAYVKA